MTESATALLTVDELLTMVAERNALLTQANQLTARIEHVRQFIGEDRFRALVGAQDVVAPTGEGPVSRRGRRETTVRDIVLGAVEGQAEGLSYDDLRQRLREAGLESRSPNTFFNTIARMAAQREVAKVGELVFSPSEFAKLPPSRVAELEVRRKYKGGTEAVLDYLSDEPGSLPRKIVVDLAKTHPEVKANAVYANLSRLVQQGVLRRDGDGRYWINPDRYTK